MRTAISPGAHGEARVATLMDVQRGPPRRDGPRAVESRRRPTLPGGLPPSTIGAGGLNCRVRDGNGWDPAAMGARNLVGVPKRRSRLGPKLRSRRNGEPELKPIASGSLKAVQRRTFSVTKSTR